MMFLSDPAPGYLWDNTDTPRVSMRFEGLEAVYDPITIERIEALDIQQGWNCLEVGGGGGSVSKWLSAKVGSKGRVLVTDISPQFLTALKGYQNNVEVLVHDITEKVGLPKNAFDFAHARLVLVHVPERELALANMVSALMPGGRILIEDFDLVLNDALRDYHPQLGVPPYMNTVVFDKLMRARTIVLEQHGADPYYARRLYAMFRSLGLKEVGVSVGGYGPWAGGSAGAKIHLANSLQSREEILATGVLSQEEFEAAVQLMKDPNWVVFSHLMISAWGRKS